MYGRTHILHFRDVVQITEDNKSGFEGHRCAEQSVFLAKPTEI